MPSPIPYSEKKRQQVAVLWASLIASVQQKRNCEVELVEDVVEDAAVDEDEGIEDEVDKLARIAAHYEELLGAQRLESEHDSAIIAAYFGDLLRAQSVQSELESLRIAAYCDDFIEAEKATMHAQFAGQLEAQRLDSEAERARIVRRAEERLRVTMNTHLARQLEAQREDIETRCREKKKELDEQIRLVQERHKQAVLDLKQIQGELVEAALSQIQVTAVDSLPLISFVYAFVCVLSAVLLVFWNISDFSVAHGTFLDALYFVAVTISTVGFGDITPLSGWMVFFCDMLSMLSRIIPFILEFYVSKLAQRFYLRYISTVESRRWRFFYLILLAAGVIVVVIVSGMLVIFLVEWDTIGSIHGHSRAQRVLHIFHLTVMTMTTVGYGDYAFGTVLGRLFATFWIPFSTTCCTVAMSVMIASFVGLISG